MNLFSYSIRRRSRISKAAWEIHPRLEALETRDLLSVTPGAGVVIPHVQVETIYYGQDWNRDGLQSDIAQFDAFLKTLVNSSFMGMLGEYGVGLGSFTGHDVLSDATSPLGQFEITLPIGFGSWTTLDIPTNTTVPDQQIQDMLTHEIDSGRVPSPDPSRLYMVVLPEGVTLRGGYHSTFTYVHVQFIDTGSGWLPIGFSETQVAYAVISHNDMNLSPFDQQTLIGSHELAEAVTDPFGTGWRDYTHSPSNSWWEIGDGALDGVYGYFDGYVVQQMWLNSMNGGFLPASDVVPQYGSDPNAVGPVSQGSYDGLTYLQTTIVFTTYREWEIAPGDFSGWFPVGTFVPEYVDGPVVYLNIGDPWIQPVFDPQTVTSVIATENAVFQSDTSTAAVNVATVYDSTFAAVNQSAYVANDAWNLTNVDAFFGTGFFM